MLAKQYRLPSSVKLTNSRFFSTELFTVRVAPNHLPESRFGFVIGKKIDKRAVSRNRIRRVFRSCIEQRREQIAIGYDMLFFLKKDILEMKQEEVSNYVERFLQEKQLLQ